MTYEINETLAANILEVADAGLVAGIGKPVPGKMCVEAVVCYAMGLPHSDEPTCVGAAVRSFGIRLNDCSWSSPEARAKGMRKLAIAQLGSNEIDQTAFAKLVAEGTIRRVVPVALRAAASVSPKFAEELEAAAVRCENEGTKEAAISGIDAAYVAAEANNADITAEAATAADSAEAAGYAHSAADTAAGAAKDAGYANYYAADSAEAAGYAHSAANAAYAAGYAHSAANAAYAKSSEQRDEILAIGADIGLQALIKLGSPGCKYLHLTDLAGASE